MQQVPSETKRRVRTQGQTRTCWENIREKREIANLLDSLILIRELEQVEVCVRDHHILRLPSDPTSHVHVAVCGAWTGRVDIEANACVAALARHASSAGNVERDRALQDNAQNISFIQEIHLRRYQGIEHVWESCMFRQKQQQQQQHE